MHRCTRPAGTTQLLCFVLQEAVALVDKTVSSVTAPQERMVKLLQARDKKATLLEMAGKTGTPCSLGLVAAALAVCVLLAALCGLGRWE